MTGRIETLQEQQLLVTCRIALGLACAEIKLIKVHCCAHNSGLGQPSAALCNLTGIVDCTPPIKLYTAAVT